MTKTIDVEDLKAHAGEHLGSSDWHEITQDQVNLFADATGDEQWIHVDPERAKGGPFGGTIAHGFYVLSRSTGFVYELLEGRGTTQILNYGLNRVRFTSPTPVGSRVRMGMRITDVAEVA